MAKELSISYADIILTLTKADLLIYQSDKQKQSSYHCFKTRYQDIQNGDIFIAYQGTATDSHEFIELAIERGASLIISEKPLTFACSYILVKNGRKAWAHLSAALYGNPQLTLKTIAVTGTNGKTSTVWLIKELLNQAGVKCLAIGTLGAFLSHEYLPTTHTTPDPDVLFKLFALAVSKGIEYVVMEVSSHSIAQGKVDPIKFAALAFTSFSRDHLDFHHSMQDYALTKYQLIEKYLDSNAYVVIHQQVADFFKESFAIDLSNFTLYQLDNENLDNKNSLSIKILDEQNKVEIAYKNQKLQGFVPLIGTHTLENFLAAWAISSTITPIPSDIWNKIAQIPGRLQIVSSGHHKNNVVQVIVDYAHTPDALEKALLALKPQVKGHLWLIFGCGGNRDKGKRSEMAKVAERFADRIIVTSDNPRDEDPNQIISDILKGFTDSTKIHVEVDRKAAISLGIRQAQATDLILIAGKGHETYQIIGNHTLTFDDREVAKKFLDSI